jgi:hypothetical protein
MAEPMIPEDVVEAAHRAEMARIIMSPESFDGGPMSCGPNAVYAARIAAALIKAGHRKAEHVTTRVEQVNLPNGTVVLTATGDVLQHFNGYWFAPGSSYRHHLDEVTLPVTILHRGDAK